MNGHRTHSITEFRSSYQTPPLSFLVIVRLPLQGFRPSAVITGNSKRPDLLVIKEGVLCVLKLSVGFKHF